MRFRVLIGQDEDGVYVAEIPALLGRISPGKTRSEAINNAKDAIAGYLESLQAHGEPIPPSITEEVVEITPCQRCRSFRVAGRFGSRSGQRLG